MIDHSEAPSSFVVEWLPRLVPRVGAAGSAIRRPRALDVAMGRGRHALALARAGAQVFGVDWRLDAIREARMRARKEGLELLTWCADVTRTPLPASGFELIVVTRYLDRALFPSLRAALKPGGAIVYETFTVDQRQHGRGPTSPAHLLERGELKRRFDEFDVLFYEEVRAPEAVARLVARRRPTPILRDDRSPSTV